MVFVCGGSAAASIVALALLSRDTIGARREKQPKTITISVSETMEQDEPTPTVEDTAAINGGTRVRL